MPVFTIHEEMLYLIDAATPQEALALFLDDPDAVRHGLEDRYMTDENGEDVDIMCEARPCPGHTDDVDCDDPNGPCANCVQRGNKEDT